MAGSILYPCRFTLIGAENPCPCGFLNDSKKACTCTEFQLMHYRARLSGPLRDRFDMEIVMKRLGRKDLLGSAVGETSSEVAGRVCRARELQTARYGDPTKTNGSVTKRELDLSIQITPAALSLLGHAIDSINLTGRGVTRVMRVARTFADLLDHEKVDEVHVHRALGLRLGAADSQEAA